MVAFDFDALEADWLQGKDSTCVCWDVRCLILGLDGVNATGFICVFRFALGKVLWVLEFMHLMLWVV